MGKGRHRYKYNERIYHDRDFVTFVLASDGINLPQSSRQPVRLQERDPEGGVALCEGCKRGSDSRGCLLITTGD